MTLQMNTEMPLDAAKDMLPQSKADNSVLFWGNYDLSKPRTRILRDGLKETGTNLIEIHADIWPDHADKSQMGSRALAIALIRAFLSYPLLIVRFLLSPKTSAVVVPYLGPLDVLVLWPFAKLRRQRVVWDMFLSLYDTVVNDRQMISRSNPLAYLLWAVEWLAARAADQVLLDTQAHADYITNLFGLSDGKAVSVPVGAELENFPRLTHSRPKSDRAQVLFYGQLIPLHGIETILGAALSERGRAVDWHIIGTGQDRHKIEEALASSKIASDHVKWEEWVPYTSLIDAIAAADICLGIFGASQKAASVVPNKVYQALFAGRAVISRASPAMSETFEPGQGLTLVPHSDPDALLDAIETLKTNGYAPMPLERLEQARPKDIAVRFKQIISHSNQTTG